MLREVIPQMSMERITGLRLRVRAFNQQHTFHPTVTPHEVIVYLTQLGINVPDATEFAMDIPTAFAQMHSVSLLPLNKQGGA